VNRHARRANGARIRQGLPPVIPVPRANSWSPRAAIQVRAAHGMASEWERQVVGDAPLESGWVELRRALDFEP
jgi:hypothetical protein